MSDLLVITPELINDAERYNEIDYRTLNYFNVSDSRRKNKFIYQYLSDFYLKAKIPFDKVIQFFRNIQVSNLNNIVNRILIYDFVR